jgi:LGFP repeat
MVSANWTIGEALDFGSASYGDLVSRNASNDGVPSSANVTAAVTGDSPFAVSAVTSYIVSWQEVAPSELPPGHEGPLPKEKVYTQVGQSDGTTPLYVAKGQAVTVSVSLTVPSTSVTPGAASATLIITGDSWATPATVALTATLISVDESTPIGQEWDALGTLHTSGTVLANAQSMPDGVGSYQTFANGTIVYSPDFGAVWLSEAIYVKLNSPSVAQAETADGQNVRDYLGYPTADTFATAEAGGQAATFEHGMIVVRASGAAWVVYGAIYGHYYGLGSIMSGTTDLPIVGLPSSDEQAAFSGRCSHFDGGDIYWKSDTGAWEIHGAIRDRWNAMGGPSSFIGYPTSDEMGVLSGSAQVGRYNTFEGGTRVAANGSFATGQARIYWSPATGAFEVYGDIRAQYLDNGGPVGALGFPTSGETDTPGGGRFNSFQNGFIVWHDTVPYGGTFTVGNSLELNLYSYQDTKHDDFNVQINITDSNGQVNHGRMPAGGNYGNGNQQFNPPVTLMTTKTITSDYTMDVWMLCIHEKLIGKDDEDGTVTAHYDIDNLWGTTDSSLYSNASFNVNMKPIPQPEIFSTDPVLFRTNLFWPFHNFDTAAMSWTEFSETYNNVGEGDLAFNILPWNWHLWERAFFQFVYRGVGKHGVCFGMCLESIYARELRTMFVEPIYNSPDNTYSNDPLGVSPSPLDANDAVVVEQCNIKQGYQLGSGYIQWLVGMEVQNQIKDAVLAFKTSRDAFANEDWPIIQLGPDALGGGHAVVPYQWLMSSGGAPPIMASDEAINSQPLSDQAWIMRVANPNATPDAYANDYIENEILINPFENTWSFAFQPGSETWSGSKGSGGRIYCTPFSQLNYEQGMIGDIIIGLLEGLMVVIFSGNGQTQQITDEDSRTYFSYASQPTGSPGEATAVTAPVTPTPTLMREINTDPKTRIPDMAFIAPCQSTTVTGIGSDALPYEMYCIVRPVQGFRWPEAKTKDATGIARTLPQSMPSWLLSPSSSAPQLTFDLNVDRRSPYRWNLSCPRMSVDIASAAAADAVDHVTITNPGSGSQTVVLSADAKAGPREFALTIAGWRGNYGTETLVYSLKGLTLQPGASLIASVSNGGKELWVHNPGIATTFTLEIYAGAKQHAIVTKPNVTLDAGNIARIGPAAYFDTFDVSGQLVQRANAVGPLPGRRTRHGR